MLVGVRRGVERLCLSGPDADETGGYVYSKSDMYKLACAESIFVMGIDDSEYSTAAPTGSAFPEINGGDPLVDADVELQ